MHRPFPSPLAAGRALVAVLALAVAPATAVAQPLEQVVRVALQAYPTIALARSNRDAARFGIDQAQAQHYPTVALNSQRRIAGTPFNLSQPQLNLNLYANGAIEAGVERERWREQALASSEVATVEDVAIAATAAWFRLLRAQRLVEVSTRNLQRHASLVEDFAEIARIDPGRRYDLVQSRSRMEQVRQAVLANEAERSAAREALARYYPGPVDPAALELPPEPPAPVPAQYQQALEDHPQVEAARRALLSAEANARAARAARGPRLDLQSTAGRDAASIVVLTWPVFDVGRGAAEDAAFAALTGARASIEEQQRIVRERFQTSEQAWREANRRATVSRDAIDAATELVDVYKQQFQIGRRNLLDLLNAYSELNSAETVHESARIDGALARYQMDYAVGRLAARFVPSQP